MKTGEIIIYQTSDGNIKIDVRIEEESVWLTQDQMAVLFGKAKSTINEHIKNVYEERELQQAATMKKFGNSEFQQKAFNYYNLDIYATSIDYAPKDEKTISFFKIVQNKLLWAISQQTAAELIYRRVDASLNRIF
jgi:hypothetical protein